MSFSRVNPAGWNLNDEVTSAQINQLDINTANSLDKVGGDTAVGHCEFEDLELLDSGVGQMTGDGKIDLQGAIETAKAFRGAKYTPLADFQQLNTAWPHTITFDLAAYDHFVIELRDSLDPLGSAIVGNGSIVLSTATGGDADKAVERGARFRFTFLCDGFNQKGIGMAIGAWPATVFGMSPSDEIGPQFSDEDSMDFVLVQTEPVGGGNWPRFRVESVAHGIKP